jgi:hypothetical protein
MIVATCALQGAAFAAATEVIDVSGFGASRTVNELIFVQVAGGGSAGSGNINPFVRIQQSPGEQGYNTSASAEFDEKGGSLNPNLQIVQFVLPSGYSFTIPNVSNAEDIDSDADTVMGNAMLITVIEGSEGGAGAGDLVGQVDPIVVNLGGFERRIDAGLTCPVVIECPADVTLECSAGLDSSPFATSEPTTMGCCNIVRLDFNDYEVSDCGDSRTITRVWTAEDACGNSASCTQMIVIVDTTNPILIGVPEDTLVECDAIPATADVTAVDDCSTPVCKL